MFIPCTYKYVMVHSCLYKYVITVHFMYIDRNLYMYVHGTDMSVHLPILNTDLTASSLLLLLDHHDCCMHHSSTVSCLLHQIPSKITISIRTWYKQVHTRIYSIPTLYVLACTLFATTLHVPSGPISLATPASLSSALQPLLLSSLFPVTSLFN